MASRSFGAKPLSKQTLGYCQLYHRKETFFYQNKILCIQENAYENIFCEIVAILTGGVELNN